jgi:hypothetical protein
MSNISVGGFASSLCVENTNRPDLCTVQFWQGDAVDDGKDNYVLFISSGDSNRPNSRNVGIRVNALNPGNGHATGVEIRMWGWLPGDFNNGLHVRLEPKTNGFPIRIDNPDFGGLPVFAVDRKGVISSRQLTDMLQRLDKLERRVSGLER